MGQTPGLMADVSIDDLWQPIHQEPRRGQYCIVWIDRGWLGSRASSAGSAHYEGGGRFDLRSPGGSVTHWMPFPQGPPTTACDDVKPIETDGTPLPSWQTPLASKIAKEEGE